MRMNGGRAETDVEYDIGFDDTGRIHALEIQVRTSRNLQFRNLSHTVKVMSE